MNAIYLDNNASTPTLPAVWEAMQPYLFDRAGNASSAHRFGRQARQGLEDARDRLAALLGADSDEVIFTSGATEANNLALLGLTRPEAGPIVTSAIEHPCVLEPIRALCGRGHTLQLLPVTPEGVVRADDGFPEDVRLVSVMLANHETGAVQPVAALAHRLAGRAPFHCDAAAAAGKMPIDFHAIGVTSLTISGHKFHGPQGVGVLVVRRRTALQPLFWGGHQQGGKRPGTEPVALAVGMAAALDWSMRNLAVHRALLLDLRGRFLNILHAQAAPVVLNGPVAAGLPHALNLSFPGCQADALMMSLDLAGVACSTGSACSSGSLLPSPVLAAMGKSGAALNSAMRFSLSPLLSGAEVEEAAHRIAHCVQKLRRAASEPEAQADP